MTVKYTQKPHSWSTNNQALDWLHRQCCEAHAPEEDSKPLVDLCLCLLSQLKASAQLAQRDRHAPAAHYVLRHAAALSWRVPFFANGIDAVRPFES